MKKSLSMLAIVAFLFAIPVNAQEKPKEAAKKECSMKDKKSCSMGKKSCSAEEMKACSKDKKAGCCAAKKAEKKS